jgi:hypothetical protein
MLGWTSVSERPLTVRYKRRNVRFMGSMAGRDLDDVVFEVEDEADALIRGRGGELWIWPSENRKPYATSWPPGVHKADWTTYSCSGLVVHVDAGIVPPRRWVISSVPSEGLVVARWDGLDPQVFGRLPLAQPDEEPAELPNSVLAHVRRFLVVPALAWVFAVLWALRFVGVSSGWLWAARTAFISALGVAAVIVWLREKLAERREDKALEAQLERSRLQVTLEQ